MPKVYHVNDTFCDWQTGKPLPDQNYVGKCYFVKTGWLETWIEDGERAYRGISNLCRACDGKLIVTIGDPLMSYCPECDHIVLKEES